MNIIPSIQIAIKQRDATLVMRLGALNDLTYGRALRSERWMKRVEEISVREYSTVDLDGIYWDAVTKLKELFHEA